MFFAGIDVGSRTTKAVLLDEARTLVSFDIAGTGVHGRRAAEGVFEACLGKANIQRADVTAVVSTGYGRKGVDFASFHLTEIACHARGILHAVPGVRTIIDIGGQDSKVILLDSSGSVVDFAMNDRCAAGTGRFLEVMARLLEMDLPEMASIPYDSGHVKTVNSVCTVFAESEVVALLAEGCPVDDVVRGLNSSVAERTMGLLQRIRYDSPLAMTGGVAKNRGVVSALEERLKLSLNIPAEPQIIGALGAACMAHKRSREREGAIRRNVKD